MKNSSFRNRIASIELALPPRRKSSDMVPGLRLQTILSHLHRVYGQPGEPYPVAEPMTEAQFDYEFDKAWERAGAIIAQTK